MMKSVHIGFFFLIWIEVAHCVSENLVEDLRQLNSELRRITFDTRDTEDEKQKIDKINEFKIRGFQKLRHYLDEERVSDENLKRQFDLFMNPMMNIFPYWIEEQMTVSEEGITKMAHDSRLKMDQYLKSYNLNTLENFDIIHTRWEEIGQRMNSEIVRNVINMFASIRRACRSLGFEDPLSFWKATSGYTDSIFQDEIENLWESSLSTPYRYFMSSMRKEFPDLYTVYPEIENPSAPIPAFLYDLIERAYTEDIVHAEQEFSSTLMYERLVKPFSKPNKNLKLRGLTAEAQKYLESLGFPELPKSFWQKSKFLPSNNSHYKIQINYVAKYQFWMEISAPPNALTFKHILSRLLRLHQYALLDKKKHPMIYFEPEYIPFSAALSNAILMPASSISYLTELGFIAEEESPTYIMREWMKGQAVREFTSMASGMAFTLWEWDVVDCKTKYSNIVCDLWNKRYKYEGVVPNITAEDPWRYNSHIDGISDNYPFGEYKSILDVTTILLQYQIFASFCKTAKQYDPEHPQLPLLHNCDFRNNSLVGDLIRKVLSMGSSQPWRDILGILNRNGSKKISAQGFLDYYYPVLHRLTKAKKEKNSISFYPSINYCSK